MMGLRAHQQTHSQQPTLLRRGRESTIQEESLHYERLKHSGEHPIVGVHTFLDQHRGENVLEAATLTRSTKEEKDARLAHVRDFQARHAGGEMWGATAGRAQAGEPGGGTVPSPLSPVPSSFPDARLDALAPWTRPSGYALARLQHTARTGGNLFAELLQTVCSCSLGQSTHALCDVGGQYRRSM